MFANGEPSKKIMRIQYMSDLHMELYRNSKYIRDNGIPVAGDVLVLAGDTAYLGDRSMPNRKMWETMSRNYRRVMLVPGNHEFYGDGDVLAFGESWHRMISPNVGYHQNETVRVDDTDFVLSTLWSHIPPEDEYFVHRGMNDFRQILYGGRRFTPADFNAEHDKCLAFVKRAVEESDAEKIVVVTHHLPTYAVADARYRNALTSAFATELGNYIASTRVNVWIFGHSHYNTSARIGGTMLLCNQLGYVDYGEEREGFNAGRFVEV